MMRSAFSDTLGNSGPLYRTGGQRVIANYYEWLSNGGRYIGPRDAGSGVHQGEPLQILGKRVFTAIEGGNVVLRRYRRRRCKAHAPSNTERAAKSLRRAGIDRGAESSAALNWRHCSAGRINRVRSANAISAAACEDLIMNSVSFTCCNLAAWTSMALICGRTRKLMRVVEMERRPFGRDLIVVVLTLY